MEEILNIKAKPEKKLNLQLKALIILAVFLLIMLVLTFVSRHADELITAQVKTISPRPMIINNVNYSACVPLQVLHKEGNKTYIFLVNEEDTVLGKKTVAEKIEAKIKDEDSSYAALGEGFISSQEFILDSNKPFEMGDRVHIAN